MIKNEESKKLLKSNNLNKYPNSLQSFNDKTTFFDNLISIICCVPKLQLTKTDIINLTNLNYLSIIKFDNNDKYHISKLEELYKLVFKKNSNNILNNDIWIDFGFQSCNPSTDFRAGGLLSLDILLDFCEKYENLNDIIEFNKTNKFCFAIISINNTFFLKQLLHFGLIDKYNNRIHKDIVINKKGLLNFCNFLNKNNDAFNIINYHYNIKLYKEWKNICETNSNIKLDDFNKYEKEEQKCFKNILENNKFSNIDEFITQFKNTKIKFN